MGKLASAVPCGSYELSCAKASGLALNSWSGSILDVAADQAAAAGIGDRRRGEHEVPGALKDQYNKDSTYLSGNILPSRKLNP